MEVCLRTQMVSDDPLVRIGYCRQVAIPLVQESARSLPAAVARGWTTAAELREYRKPFDDAGIAIAVSGGIERDPGVDIAEGECAIARP